MGSIKISQISEALNYDKNIDSMVFSLEKKRAAQNPDPLVVPYSQVIAEALTAARASLDQLRSAGQQACQPLPRDPSWKPSRRSSPTGPPTWGK